VKIVRRLPAEDDRHSTWGLGPDTAIERALGARVADEDWDQRLSDAFQAFRELHWPQHNLNQSRSRPRPVDEEAAT
jgi:hypothetical protein